VVALFTGNESKLNIKDKSSYKFMFPEAVKERWDFARKLLRPGQTRMNSFSLICVVAVVCVLQ
jgi:hypothetical protein